MTEERPVTRQEYPDSGILGKHYSFREDGSVQYGHFDNENREYVIDRPDTPAPWANYLGDPEYGAIISNNSGGYSFARSGANGRIIRYIFNGFDRPGRYIYLKDRDSGDFWSASWQPVGKSLSQYHSICRHGLGYTVMEADYAQIHSEVLYYVPEGQSYEVWRLCVKNLSSVKRNLVLTGYCEFTNHSNYEQDMVNLQYSRFITRTKFRGNRVVEQIHGNLDAQEDNQKVDDKCVTERFFALAGAPVQSFCGNREDFLGPYHGYQNPQGVIDGKLNGAENYCEYSCGALSAECVLEPGEEKTIAFLLGMHKDPEAEEIAARYGKTGAETEKVCAKEWKELKSLWKDRLSGLEVHTPSPAFDTMVNIWNAYNCYMTFIWSRAASFVYCGLRNGYGYRDTVQDIQGIIHLKPEMAKEKLRFMLSAQVDNGAGLPLVKFTHHPGHEDTPDDLSYVQETGHPAYRADDALWLFPTVFKYLAETGDLVFLDEEIPFANRDTGTVYEHLKRAISFSENHLGPHNMPAGLYADWNDCLRLGKNGESVFVAFQFYYAMRIMRTFAEYRKDMEYACYLEKQQAKLGEILNQECWNQDRFIRGFTEEGSRIGDRSDPEANMWLNPQSWSVISGMATAQQAETAMENVYHRLNTDFGAILMDPPYHKAAFDGALAVIYNPGTKENAGIFSQSQGWLILAEALLGHGDRAFLYFMENAPAAQNDRAQIRKLEPYCYGQFTEGKASPHFGRSHVHWLTGTASTVMVSAVEGILGLRPEIGGIRISPSIPHAWEELEITKRFRGKELHILVKNPDHRQSGVQKITLNGEDLSGDFIQEHLLQERNDILVTM